LGGYACLTANDGEVHTIATATYRIGRLADNDLVLRDPSVSRHHAEIRRQRDGSFQVLDLDSMNGLLVNGKKVRENALADGDSLEVGDVRLLFSARSEVDLIGEDTVMLKTEIPATPFPEAMRARR
jgi:pSer/pThr/pTyr-binding forkhead associated (FHA) protein